MRAICAFRRHVRVRSYEGGAHLLGAVELCTEAEVGDLDLARRVEQNVARLDVAVHLS